MRQRNARAEAGPAVSPASGGLEWIVEAFGCDPRALSDRACLASLFDRLIAEMGLHPVAPAAWHAFPHTGGVTGFCMLSESHLACHTFPEYGSLCLNLFCCRPRPDCDFAGALKGALAAERVLVRRVRRPFSR